MKQRQNTVCQNQFPSRDMGGIKIYFKGKLLCISPTSWFAQLVSGLNLPKLISLIKNVGIIFLQYAVYLSNFSYICEIFIPKCFLKRKYCDIILGKLQWAEMWHPVTDSIFCVLMMLEYMLCPLNMQLCSLLGPYWHNFLRLVVLVQDLSGRMNSRLHDLIWLPFQNNKKKKIKENVRH